MEVAFFVPGFCIGLGIVEISLDNSWPSYTYFTSSVKFRNVLSIIIDESTKYIQLHLTIIKARKGDSLDVGSGQENIAHTSCRVHLWVAKDAQCARRLSHAPDLSKHTIIRTQCL